MPSEPLGNVHLPYLRRLPAVDELLRTPQAQLWQARMPRHIVADAVRQALKDTRHRILQTTDEAALAALPVGAAAVLAQVEAILRAAQGRELQPLINATGVIVHTNLGRSLLAGAAVDGDRERLTALLAAQDRLLALLAKLENAMVGWQDLGDLTETLRGLIDEQAGFVQGLEESLERSGRDSRRDER